MKNPIIKILIALSIVAVCIGCKMMTNMAAQAPAPVVTTNATTGVIETVTPNQTALIIEGVAEKLKSVNAVANPTPYNPLVDQALNAVILLAGAAAGFFGHKSASASGALIVNSAPTANPKT